MVNIDKMECTCKKWSISGLPCCHALSAMKFLNLKGEDFIAHWFKKSTYEETYNSVVYPINGHQLWEVTAYPDVLPPIKRIMPGRPKKKRRLEPWELKKDETALRKGGIRKRCVVCREIGHNRTACPKKPVPPPEAPSPSQQTGPVAPSGPSQQTGPAAPSGPSQQSAPPTALAPSQQSGPLPAATPSQQRAPANQSQLVPPPSQSQCPSSNQIVQPMRNKLQTRRGCVWKPRCCLNLLCRCCLNFC